ncbi:hypothetical protein ACFLSJ_07590 [Verrucomicrobiota bacterium]
MALEAGDRKQLFIDDRFVDSSQGLRRCVNPPSKAGVVLEPIPEEEGPRVSVASVLEVDGEYRMYYGLYVPVDWVRRDWPEIPHWARHMACLAVSGDGIHWERQRAGLFDIGRGKTNAIVMPTAMGTVFQDPRRTRGSRFWFMGHLSENPWWEESKGAVYRLELEGRKVAGALHLCHSPDGIHWKRVKEPIVPFWCDTRNQAFFDHRLNRYVAYVRGREKGLRVVCRGESPELDSVPWPFEVKPGTGESHRGMYAGMNSAEWPVVLKPDEQDPPQTDIYTPNVEVYSWAEDVYLAWSPLYRHYDGFDSRGRDHRGQYPNDGPVETQLSVSRDGIRWHRFRRPYVGLGAVDEIDGGTIYMGLGMIRKGNEIWQYCSGGRSTHGNYEDHPDWPTAVIRLVQRLDGFVSLDAGPEGGELVTPPLVFSGSRLKLNIDCGAMGEAWVELLDEEGNALPGYTLQDSVPIDRNGVAQEAWWRNGPDVRPLAGRPVRLRIKMRSAKLYAFQFGPTSS